MTAPRAALAAASLTLALILTAPLGLVLVVAAAATTPGFPATAPPPATGPGAGADVDAMLPPGYRNGRSAAEAVAWALGQVGAWRDARYCLRFVARNAYQRPWDGASIPRAHLAWDHAPAFLRYPRDLRAPRGAVVVWDARIGGGAGHIGISLGDGRMVTTTDTAVAILPIATFAPQAYLGWMPPYFTSR